MNLPIVQRRAERFGIETPLCRNCQCGIHETDGNHGEIDCGWYCEAKQEEIEPDDLCVLWLPDFWETPFANEVDGDNPETMTAAMEKYKAAIKSK